MTDWNNLRPGTCDDEANLIDPLTLGHLLTVINCNLPTINRATVRHQFEELLKNTVRDAREVFAANIDVVVKDARKTRAAR